MDIPAAAMNGLNSEHTSEHLDYLILQEKEQPLRGTAFVAALFCTAKAEQKQHEPPPFHSIPLHSSIRSFVYLFLPSFLPSLFLQSFLSFM